VKALITGACGFVGNHLVRLLISKGIEVWGTKLKDNETMDRDIADRVTLRPCDVTDAGQVKSVLTEYCPDYIVHLAAQSSVARSWENPVETYRINVMGTVNLLEGAIALVSSPRVLLVGSSEEYGKVSPEQMPLNEGTPLNPANPYGSSKAAVSLLFNNYYVKYGLPVIMARAFNHIGPGQAPGFVTVDFARQVAEIENGLKEPVMTVGNLEACRDFSDVRDVVEAYRLLIEQGNPGEVYNIASGKAYPISKVLDILLEKARVRITVKPDLSKMRPADIPLLQGDISKISAQTGWKPVISLEQSLEDILNSVRQSTQRVWLN
jgi:GDP-4-dehydro-6-deoxy-D-mannose reductase